MTILRKLCHNFKHFSELAPHHTGKTAGIDMIRRNYVGVSCEPGKLSEPIEIPFGRPAY